jgi:hypothetical protein
MVFMRLVIAGLGGAGGAFGAAGPYRSALTRIFSAGK